MRNIFNINETWYFSKEAACAPSALPADWEAVQLPHTWNATDGQDGGEMGQLLPSAGFIPCRSGEKAGRPFSFTGAGSLLQN